HNYHYPKHPHPQLLNTIISPPPLLAHSINLHYYPSTLPPHFYPSPNKTTQSLTSPLPLIQPNSSHLLPPFPSHSLMPRDNKIYHPPIPLLLLIQPPHPYIQPLLNHNINFKQKLHHQCLPLPTIHQNPT
ncbi:putative inorganic carbon transporter subunit DabA, partial [Staphylococcus hominis]|uniref:putative inorganic carbon transporter subunit DabA n=1 Tax=Staphylococcus hominis TaxID=1290 RepID=UPI0011A7F629